MQTKTKSKKAARRALRNTQPQQHQQLDFKKDIRPLTLNQKRAFDAFYDGKHLFMHGTAGTGKSFVGLGLALSEDIKVVIVRSAVQTREIGFMPGGPKDKNKEFEAPYVGICEEIYGQKNAYEMLKSRGKIEFISTSFIRGITLSNCIVVVDECQSMTAHEANSIITRVGDNCQIIFCGDIRQNDLNPRKEQSGLNDFMKIIRRMPSFEFIEFMPEDIVRSKFVREYILIRNDLEDSNDIAPLSVCA